MSALAIIFTAFYLSVFLLLAAIDIKKRIVPNKIVYPSIIIGLAISPFWAQSGIERSFLGHSGMWACLLSSLSGGALFFAVFLLLVIVSKGGMGGGDIKLAAFIGVAVGLTSLPVALLITTIGVAIVVIPLLVLRIKSRTDQIPFAPFLCMGGIIALIWGASITSWIVQFAQR